MEYLSSFKDIQFAFYGIKLLYLDHDAHNNKTTSCAASKENWGVKILEVQTRTTYLQLL